MAPSRTDRLTFPQQTLLHHAARRRSLFPDEPDRHYAFIGRGQPATARKLASLGLGTVEETRAGARFWITDQGYEVAAALPGEGGIDAQR